MKMNYLYISVIWTPFSRIVRPCHLHVLQDLLFVWIKIITVPLQKGSRGCGWLTAEEKSYTNNSITFLNVDNITLYTEFKSGGIIYVHIHLKHLWPWIYPYITQYFKAIRIGILDPKVNLLRDNNPENNTTNHLFTPILRLRIKLKIKIRLHWS